MVTVSAMLLHIDSMVLDYIERRWNILPEMFPIQRNRVKTQRADKDTTLEEIYFRYFLGWKSGRRRSLSNILKRSKYHIPTHTLNLRGLLPRLPQEIVEQIIVLCPIKQLFRLRTLSRRLNEIISNQLRHHSESIDVSTSENTKRFLSSFENRIQSLAHPFGGYFSGMLDQAISQVIDSVGAERIVTLELVLAIHLPFELLARLQNISWMSVMGLPNISDSEVKKTVKLPRLRNLTLHGYKGTVDRKEVDFKYLQSWLRLAPALRNFESTTVKLSPFEAMHLRRSHACISKILSRGLSISWREREMEVEMDVMFIPTQSKIVSYADYVRTLKVPYGFQGSLPNFRRLNSLTLFWPYRLSAPDRIQPNALPHLTHITLSNAISRDFSAFYRDLVFEGVASLHLIDHNWSFTPGQPPLFHLIFPRVQTLELTGCLSKCFIRYVASHFQNVSHFKFANFEGPAQLPLLQVRASGQDRMKWPFAHFHNLKNVDFTCGSAVRSTLITLVWLTLHKYMQPLEKLKVAIEHTRKDERWSVDEERNLFYSMRELKYHKELEFVGFV